MTAARKRSLGAIDDRPAIYRSIHSYYLALCPWGCGRAVEWWDTPRGKRMPLDQIPDPNGPFIVVDGVVRRYRGGDELRYTSHFDTCQI